ncbi:hypothetical protein ACQY0O_007882 [Thecaphora frezii]
MRLQLAFLIVVQAVLVALVQALDYQINSTDYYTFADYDSVSLYTEHTSTAGLCFEDKLALQYKPWIRVENGCDLHAAVFGERDNKAVFSRGLDNHDKDDSGCRLKVHQQFYANWDYTDKSNTTLAVVYSMYFPRFSSKNKIVNTNPERRHFWQAATIIHNVTKDAHGSPAKSEPFSVSWTTDFTEWGGTRLWSDLKPEEKMQDSFEPTPTHVRLKLFYEKPSYVAHLGTTGHYTNGF